MWPTQRKALEDNGMVAASSLQALMQRMEAESIKTCWPHPAVNGCWSAMSAFRFQFRFQASSHNIGQKGRTPAMCRSITGAAAPNTPCCWHLRHLCPRQRYSRWQQQGRHRDWRIWSCKNWAGSVDKHHAPKRIIEVLWSLLTHGWVKQWFPSWERLL